MSDGPLGPGKCVETQIGAISDVLASTSEIFNVNQFVNPQLVNIANMFQSSTNTRQELDNYRQVLNTMVPPPPDLMILLEQVDDFEAKLNDLDYAIQRYQIWTNFLSGKSGQYPEGGWAGLNTSWIFGGYDENGVWQSGPNPAFIGLLMGFTFVGLWGTAKGGNQTEYGQCKADDSNPCDVVNKILGPVMGLADTVISALISGLNTMVDFAASILDYIAQITGLIENLVAVIANGIAELCGVLVKALRDGIARMLNGLKLDPCLATVINNCCGADLKGTLGI